MLVFLHMFGLSILVRFWHRDTVIYSPSSLTASPGTNAFMYYITFLFQMAGLSGTNNLTISSIQYIINTVMTVPALLFIDKLPRRKVMMSGSLLMAILLFTGGAVMATQGHAVPGGLKNSPTITWVIEGGGASKAIIVCSYLFIATFACTWG
jgi:hypothetical protein